MQMLEDIASIQGWSRRRSAKKQSKFDTNAIDKGVLLEVSRRSMFAGMKICICALWSRQRVMCMVLKAKSDVHAAVLPHAVGCEYAPAAWLPLACKHLPTVLACCHCNGLSHANQ